MIFLKPGGPLLRMMDSGTSRSRRGCGNRSGRNLESRHQIPRVDCLIRHQAMMGEPEGDWQPTFFVFFNILSALECVLTRIDG